MKIILAVLFLTLDNAAFAQSIKKGDVFDYTTKLKFQDALDKTISIPELRGQYVILDFFATGCIVCFQSMPKVNALQQKYAGKVQFLLIGKQDGQIEKVYEKVRKKAGLELAVAFDTILFKKLKVEHVPLYVWIKPDGRVFTVSHSLDLTSENIDRFIAGESFISEKEKEKIPYNPYRPLLLQGNGGPDSVYLMRSVLARWTPDQDIMSFTKITPGSKSFQAMGKTVVDLFMYAILGQRHWSTDHPFYGNVYSRAIIDQNDSIPFSKERYNYSLELPDTNIQQKMKQDLEHLFGVRSWTEERMMPCWNIVLRDKDTTRISSSDVQSSGTNNLAGIKVRGFLMEYLAGMLEMYMPKEPVFINHTGIRGRINLNIDAIMTDINEVRRELRKNGLDLLKSIRLMKVVVIKRMKPRKKNMRP